MATCKTCNADIAFVRLPSGKSMPVDGLEAERQYLHLDQPGHPQVVLVTDQGVILRGRQGAQHDSGVTAVDARVSHFSTCPQAAEHRRPRGQ